jgi:hypothetical protein
MDIRLATLRNRIAEERFGPQDQRTIDELRAMLNQSSVPYAPLALHVLDKAAEDVGNKLYSSAARELQLIHDLPLEDRKLNGWNEDFFYKFHLPEYLESTSDVERSKAVINLLAQVPR